MKAFSIYGNEVNIVHFPGSALARNQNAVSFISANAKPEPVEGLSVVSCWTEYKKAIFAQQCEKNGIEIVNAAEGWSGIWKNTEKIGLILQALKSLEGVVLIMDAYDALIVSTKGLLEKYRSQPYATLWNASSFKYPNEVIEHLPERVSYGMFRYLNAGCCIGEAEVLREIYSKALEYRDRTFNPEHSEQKLIRHVFADFLKDNPSQKRMQMDHQCSIFQTAGRSTASIEEDAVKYSPIVPPFWEAFNSVFV